MPTHFPRSWVAVIRSGFSFDREPSPCSPLMEQLILLGEHTSWNQTTLQCQGVRPSEGGVPEIVFLR